MVESRAVYRTGGNKNRRSHPSSCQGVPHVFRTRRSHPRPFPAFRSFDRSFERFVNDALFSDAAPGFKVEQDEKAWTVTLDLPGVAQDELSINIEGSIVRIETKDEAKRQFKAAYELPQDIDADSQRRQARERRADADPGQEGAGQQRAPDRGQVRSLTVVRA